MVLYNVVNIILKVYILVQAKILQNPQDFIPTMEDIDKKWSKNADKTKERIARLQKLHNLRTAGTSSA